MWIMHIWNDQLGATHDRTKSPANLWQWHGGCASWSHYKQKNIIKTWKKKSQQKKKIMKLRFLSIKWKKKLKSTKWIYQIYKLDHEIWINQQKVN